MTDYLLVHGAGQGAWSWGKVWGFMTAPLEHPPRLYAYRPVDKVFSLDLPDHGADADGDTAAVSMDECVQSIVRAVERHGLHDVVLVGHGFAGSLILQAAAQLPTPPKRVVLIAGIVPPAGKSMASELPFVFHGPHNRLDALVHRYSGSIAVGIGAGQGAWSWGKVWGYMTAPLEHPPRLYAYRPADKVFSLDLPGHGADAPINSQSLFTSHLTSTSPA